MMGVEATLHSGTGVRKGSWTDEEDNLLRQCIQKHGEGSWHRVPQRAGLNRCRKSCRLRWLNYLKPNIKRGQFSEDEVDLIIRLHKLLGNKWSLIAGRIPGRTANDVKNYWNTHLHKKLSPPTRLPKHPIITLSAPNTIIRPQPCTISKALSFMGNNSDNNKHNNGLADQTSTFHDLLSEDEDDDDNDNDNDNNNNANARWWEKLGEKEENGLGYHEPSDQDVSNMWPSSSIQVPPRGPIVNHLQLQDHSIWEEDDLWNFDVNLWG